MKERHGGPVAGQHNGLTVIDCAACGFKHLDPLPTDEDMARMYESGRYYTQEKPAYISTSVRDREWWRASYDRQLDLIPERQYGEPTTILDIGCGPGMLLEAARARGWRCMGIEPSPVAAEHAKSLGLDVQCCSFADFDTAFVRFDVVAATGVLEHVRDPRAVIDMAAKVLAPGGALLIGVPRDFSPLQIATKLPPWWIHHTHCNYFSIGSLCRLLDRHGFRVFAETTDYPMEWFILGGEDYVSEPELGPKCHQRRIAFEANLGRAETSGLYRALAQTGMGRSILVAVRKPGDAREADE